MLEDIRLTPEEIQEVITPDFVKKQGRMWNILESETTLANAATDKANKWWIEWVERAILVHPDNRKAWERQYLEALRKLV